MRATDVMFYLCHSLGIHCDIGSNSEMSSMDFMDEYVSDESGMNAC